MRWPHLPLCGNLCGGQVAKMPYGKAWVDGRRDIVRVCTYCDGPTLETMWGEAADQAKIAAWVDSPRERRWLP